MGLRHRYELQFPYIYRLKLILLVIITDMIGNLPLENNDSDTEESEVNL